MSAIVRFRSLYGTEGEEPLCHVLEVDDFTFLLDCGWDSSFNIQLLDPLKKIAKKVNAVLISQADLRHLGALPYAVGKLGLSCPIYSTIPVYKMGQMFLYDAYQSRHNILSTLGKCIGDRADRWYEDMEDFDIFTLDDVDAAFEYFVQLKYSQHVTVQGRDSTGIEITPYAAGHMLGGAVWKIKKDTEDIVYAVDYNHRKERHLNPTSLGLLKRPSLLITSATNALETHTSKKNRDSELTDTIIKTLRSGGNVLLPVDSAGRVLELLMIVDQYWNQHKITNFAAAFLTFQSFNTVEFAKSTLEWMSDSVMSAFDHSRENPFALKCVRLCYDIEQFAALPSPKLVLATMQDLESGFSREIFKEYAQDPNNLILFTSKAPPGTLARQLLDNAPGSLTLEVKRRIPLEGKELEDYQRQQQQEEEEEQRKKKKSNQMVTDESDSEDEDEDNLIVAKNAFQHSKDMTSFRFTEEGFRHPMFPFKERTATYDDYGESISMSDFIYDEILAPVESKVEEKVKEEIEMDLPEEKALPTKCIKYNMTLAIRCSFHFIDFQGRADGRSIKTILQNDVMPRKLILIHGSEAEKVALVKHCEKNLKAICKLVLCPKQNELVDVASDTNVFKVKLRDAIVDNLRYHKVGDYKVTFVNGQIHLPRPEEMEPGIVPLMDQITYGQAPGHRAVFIGETKLNDFKQVLTQAGYRAEFYGGALIVGDSSISLRREEGESISTSTIKLEGVLSDDYFKIRQLLYGQYLTM